MDVACPSPRAECVAMGELGKTELAGCSIPAIHVVAGHIERLAIEFVAPDPVP